MDTASSVGDFVYMYFKFLHFTFVMNIIFVGTPFLLNCIEFVLQCIIWTGFIGMVQDKIKAALDMNSGFTHGKFFRHRDPDLFI